MQTRDLVQLMHSNGAVPDLRCTMRMLHRIRDDKVGAMDRNAFYFLYLLASKRRGVLYLGVTSNLPRRIEQHRQGYFSGFTKKYGVHTLVWFEEHTDIREAILREKALKRWRRAWKIALIDKVNPEWRDLWDEIKGV